MLAMKKFDKTILLGVNAVYRSFRCSRLQLKTRHLTTKPIDSQKFVSNFSNHSAQQSAPHLAPEEEYEPMAKRNKTRFNDTENQFAFGVVNSLLSKAKFNLNDEKQGDDQNCEQILQKFLEINDLEQTMTNSKYDIEDLIRVLKFLSLKQISIVLQSLTKWSNHSPFFRPYYRIWSKIDQELEDRLKTADFSDKNQVLQYLYIGNQFYSIRVANITKFNECLIQKLCSPDYDLDKMSFLHIMFYANLQRSLDPKAFSSLLKRMSKFLNELSLEETAVAAMSSFKTKTIWTEDLIKQLIAKACNEMSTQTDNLVRTEITKCIRKSSSQYFFRVQPEVRKFVDKMKQYADNTPMTLAHLLNLMTSTQICDFELMDNAINKVSADPTVFRIKDIERIFMCLSFFNNENHHDKLESICNKLHTSIDSENLSIYNYPNCLLNILHYLCILKCYPKPLIENCFDPPFLNKIQKYSKLDFQRHLLLTNTALSIEKYEEYKDILLAPEVVHRYHRWILSEEKIHNRISKKHSIINSVYMTLLSMVQNRVKLCHILPSKSHPFIVIFDDPKKTFILEPTTQLKPNMFNGCVLVFPVEWNDFAIEDNMLKGSVNLEKRLLEGMGFKVVTISWMRFMRFNTIKAKRNVISKEILMALPDFKF